MCVVPQFGGGLVEHQQAAPGICTSPRTGLPLLSSPHSSSLLSLPSLLPHLTPGQLFAFSKEKDRQDPDSFHLLPFHPPSIIIIVPFVAGLPPCLCSVIPSGWHPGRGRTLGSTVGHYSPSPAHHASLSPTSPFSPYLSKWVSVEVFWQAGTFPKQLPHHPSHHLPFFLSLPMDAGTDTAHSVV